MANSSVQAHARGAAAQPHADLPAARVAGRRIRPWREALRIKRRAFFRHLRRGVKNAELRERLIPNYRFGCKRILLSNDFYPAMDRPNVELVTQPLDEIRPDAIVAADAAERKVDCIIFATGFAASDFLVPIKATGLYGRDLHQSWKGGPKRISASPSRAFPIFSCSTVPTPISRTIRSSS